MKKIRTLLAFLLFLIAMPCLHAQSPLNLMGTGGGMVKNNEVFLSYSFGEPVTNYSIHTAAILTEGFQQPERINLTTGINDYSSPITFQYYPNPANDFIHLKWSDEWNCQQIRIENYLGQTLYQVNHQDSHEHEINISLYQPGLYFLRLINTDQQEFTKSFIKI